MLRSSVDMQADGSVVDKLSNAPFAPFVEAVRGFRHPYSDISAAALAIYAVGDQWQGADAAWQIACRDRFASETANGQVSEIHASHYLFFDRRDDVLAQMRELFT